MTSFRTFFGLIVVGVLWSCILGLQRPPPRYSQQYMPETSFTCRNKIVGSYYADPETDCQLFHVCVSVAGTVQDYKFLCPNDTAFDQESQTCADWYDVDCEAATLYYASDNFDLYRIGSGLESLHYDSIRTDAEPQDHLQRSETNDPVRSSANSLTRVSSNNYNANGNTKNKDVARGSNTGAFYNNRNAAKDEDYDNEKVYREEPIPERKKTGVRKIARKQQYNSNGNNNDFFSSSTAAPASPSYYNANNYNQRQRTSFPSSTTVRPSSQQQEHFSTNVNQKFTVSSSTYRPTTVFQETYNNYQSPSSTAKSTEYNNFNNAYNGNQNFNGFNQSPSTTAKPVSYNNKNYNDQASFANQFSQQVHSQSTTLAPSTNYRASDYTTFQQRNYNNIQRTTASAGYSTTTAAPTFYDNHNVNANDAQYNRPAAQTTRKDIVQTTQKYLTNNYAASSYVPTTYSPLTTKKLINTENNARGGDRYNAQNNDNGQYFDKSAQAKSTQFYDTTKAPKKATQYNYDNKYYETSTGNYDNYDFGRSPSGIGFSPSSINHLAESPRSTTPVPRRTGAPSTYNPNTFVSTQRPQAAQTTPRSTTYVSGSARPFSTTARFSEATTPKPKTGKKNDYDYAYYDNVGTLEYDGLDLEHVTGNKESAKISRN
ncbi:probable serine/threonine-protein kinase clkA [Orussus abietinus]|uniref:probable serine/threonine-protein kinase clkA n=1 Tax=Orussus abietinus TaxID=222816 RepID=UPI000625FA22|nr:probable serine/threonine-protein kinase clkA [Orussus abietinus]